MNLIVCAGSRHKDGWTTHDIQRLGGIDIVCDIFDLPQFIEDESCDEIEFTHALEHFEPHKTNHVLTILCDMLKIGGELYIEVPNLLWHADEILKNPKNRQVVEYMYGGQLNEFDYHYTGFTPEILVEELETAGFTIKGIEPNSSIEVRCIKNG